jgi:hypothetical protein
LAVHLDIEDPDHLETRRSERLVSSLVMGNVHRGHVVDDAVDLDNQGQVDSVYDAYRILPGSHPAGS